MFKFGYFINFKALFGVVSTDFPDVVHVKSWKNCEKAYVRTDCSRSLSNRLTSQTHPDSFQIELIHLLYSTCWREGLSCELLLLKKFFHVMFLGEQGWHSGESTRFPPMWPGFDSRTRRHMWVEFVVGSLLCSERFFSGYSGFPLSAKTNISKFQFDPECSSISYMSPGLGRLGNHSSRYRA